MHLFIKKLNVFFLTSSPSISRKFSLTFISRNYQRNSTLIKESNKLAYDLFTQLINGDRSSLARSITLVESNNPVKKQIGQIILDLVMKHLQQLSNENLFTTFRVGLTGPPGAGKSTFIENFGNFLTAKNHKVAVLAVDPSSKTTGGSLMGDKTRMPQLTLNPNAYIRPSPSGGTLGGVTRNTNEAIILCEGAGYDIVLVETMGVGQSEFAVSEMVDMFCLILPPAGGDELQGLKRGIIEVTDIVIVNKFDGELMAAGRRLASEYLSALKFIKQRYPDWKPSVCKVSSLKNTGFNELWDQMSEFYEIQCSTNRLAKIRKEQRLAWMRCYVKDRLVNTFENNQKVKLKLQSIEEQVRNGNLAPGIAAELLLNEFLTI